MTIAMDKDPFAALDVSSFTESPAAPIVRWEGWQKYAAASVPAAPALLSLEEHAVLSTRGKKEYATLRRDYHGALPYIETTDLTKIHDAVLAMAALNYSSPAGARTGAILSGLGTTGKSTIVTELGKKYERLLRKRLITAGFGDRLKRQFIPVVYVTLAGLISIRSFNALFIRFFGIPGAIHANPDRQLELILDYTEKCSTSLIIIDDIHFLRMVNADAQVVNNHLKSLASSISATFIYAGIDVGGTGLLSEGKSEASAEKTQTRNRFKVYELDSYEKNSREIIAFLKAFEGTLLLLQKQPGDLVNIASYIHDRTAGYIGAVSALLREGANLAIKNGEERITSKLLDQIKLSYGAEQHKKIVTPKRRVPAVATAALPPKIKLQGMTDPTAATEAWRAGGSKNLGTS